MEQSEKQKRYIELSGSVVEEQDDKGWMLVSFVPPIEMVAVVAGLEQDLGGERVRFADEYVWVDRFGREHFGPGERGHDRYGLNQ